MPIDPRTVRARRLRRDSTGAERRLWRALHEAALPYKLRRQHPVGPYVLDFAVVGRKLAIEVDGGQHATNTTRDAARTSYLEARGWRVVRFWNNDVLNNTAGVVEAIARELEAST